MSKNIPKKRITDNSVKLADILSMFTYTLTAKMADNQIQRTIWLIKENNLEYFFQLF